MSNLDFDAIEPVEGDVIRVSRSSRIALVSLSSVFLVIGLGLVWWSWQREDIPIKAILIAVVALVCVVASLVSLFMEFALIIGADRLQNVRNGKVVGQVPYSNIAEIVICKDGAPSLGIKLADEEDAGTFWERRQAHWYARSKQAWGYDVFITPDPSVPIELILEMIQARKEQQAKPN